MQVQSSLQILDHNILYLVSQDPGNYKDAPTEGIRRVLEIVTGEKIPRGTILETGKIGAMISFLVLYMQAAVY